MILVRFGRCDSAHGIYLFWKRIYFKGYKTPFCKVTLRKYTSQKELDSMGDPI